MNKQSQNQQILNILMTGESITSWDIITRCMITAPTKRISELRAEGHPIKMDWVKYPGKAKKGLYWYDFEQVME